MKPRSYRMLLIASACISFGGCSMHTKPAMLFDEPNGAVVALEDAVNSRSVQKAQALFGSDGDYILHTGDQVADKNRAQRFIELFNQYHALEKKDDGSYTLVVGKKKWPFPVPVVNEGKGWFYDAEAGLDEIVTRRIGQNELNTMEASRTIAYAQRIYASEDWDGDGRPEYAARLISTPGHKDGLYWPADEDEASSPLGPIVAKASSEHYSFGTTVEPQPFRGYYYKLFTTPPDESASSDALSKPGKFWLISYPATWGKSGVMTFATNERGWIYEKNLGGAKPFTQNKPVSIDNTWTRVE